MKQDKAYEIAELINYRYSAMISKVLEDNLGVKTSFIAKVEDSRPWDCYVVCRSSGNEVQHQLTATALLHQLFKTAYLQGKVWYIEEENTISFGVDLKYEHNYDGGSNGHSIMAFSINLDTEEIKIRK